MDPRQQIEVPPGVSPEFAAAVADHYTQFADVYDMNRQIADARRAAIPQASAKAAELTSDPNWLRGPVEQSLSGGRERKAIQQQAMRGVEPTRGQNAFLDSLADEQQARGNALSGMGAELTGLPAVVRGGQNLASGFADGDVMRGVGGAAEMLTGAIPGASAFRAGAKAVAPFVSSMPRAMTTFSAAPYAYGVSEAKAAGAARDAKRDAVRLSERADESNPEFSILRDSLIAKDDPRLARAIADRDAGKAKLADADNPKINWPSTAARNGARATSTAAIQAADELEKNTLAELRRDAVEKATAILAARADGRQASEDARRFQSKPAIESWNAFREDYPYLPPFSMLPALAGGALSGLMTPRLFSGENRILNSARDALSASPSVKNVVGQQKAVDMAETLASGVKQKSMDSRVGAGALAGGTIGVAPLGMDAINLPAVNPDKTAGNAFVDAMLDIDPKKAGERARVDAMPSENKAREDARSIPNYIKTAGFGALEGAAGAKIVNLMGESVRPNPAALNADISAAKQGLASSADAAKTAKAEKAARDAQARINSDADAARRRADDEILYNRRKAEEARDYRRDQKEKKQAQAQPQHHSATQPRSATGQWSGPPELLPPP